jgi:hypothetical protein
MFHSIGFLEVHLNVTGFLKIGALLIFFEFIIIIFFKEILFPLIYLQTIVMFVFQTISIH